MAGRKIRSFASSARQSAVVASVKDDGLALQVGPVQTRMSMAKLSAADKASLALGVLREGTSADHCLAAFYLLANGERDRARDQLARAAPADAEKVRAAFGE